MNRTAQCWFRNYFIFNTHFKYRQFNTFLNYFVMNAFLLLKKVIKKTKQNPESDFFFCCLTENIWRITEKKTHKQAEVTVQKVKTIK